MVKYFKNAKKAFPIYLSIYLYLYISIYLYLYISIYIYIYIYLSIYLSTYLFIYTCVVIVTSLLKSVFNIQNNRAIISKQVKKWNLIRYSVSCKTRLQSSISSVYLIFRTSHSDKQRKYLFDCGLYTLNWFFSADVNLWAGVSCF